MPGSRRGRRRMIAHLRRRTPAGLLAAAALALPGVHCPGSAALPDPRPPGPHRDAGEARAGGGYEQLLRAGELLRACARFPRGKAAAAALTPGETDAVLSEPAVREALQLVSEALGGPIRPPPGFHHAFRTPP